MPTQKEKLLKEIKSSVLKTAEEVLKQEEITPTAEKANSPTPSVSLSDLEKEIQAKQLNDRYHFSKDIQVTFHKIINYSLYITSGLILIGIIIILGRWLWIGDFKAFEEFIWTIVKMLLGAVILKLAEYGIKFPKE